MPSKVFTLRIKALNEIIPTEKCCMSVRPNWQTHVQQNECKNNNGSTPSTYNYARNDR